MDQLHLEATWIPGGVQMDFKQNYRLKSFLDGVQMESRWIYGVHVESIWNLWGSVKYRKSPWGAPIFIVYSNNKPRMIIDSRRLNEKVVADEFPLPR